MCLTSAWRFPKKAKEDIICYKVLSEIEGSYFAPFRENLVNVNKIYNARGISLNIFNKYRKGRGYVHSLPFEPPRGHLYYYCNRGTPVVFKCVIPKGTKYHVGYCDLCSKKLKFLEKVL